jgi:hypothetical protein
MVPLPCAPDHRRIGRIGRSQTKGADMLSTTSKRTIATALSGAAMAGALGAPVASAMPIDPVGAPGYTSEAPIVTPPSRPSAAVAVQTVPDAGFDVSSAAIGAAAGTGLLIVVLAAGGLAWRRPSTRGHGAAGA